MAALAPRPATGRWRSRALRTDPVRRGLRDEHRDSSIGQRVHATLALPNDTPRGSRGNHAAAR
jgi:hypothetical protein